MLVQKLAALDSGRPLPFNFELVEKLDAHARIVRLQFKTSSFASAVRPPDCKPCEKKSDMTCNMLNNIAIIRLPYLTTQHNAGGKHLLLRSPGSPLCVSLKGYACRHVHQGMPSSSRVGGKKKTAQSWF